MLCFLGLFRGALDARASDITEGMKIAAAYALADFIPALAQRESPPNSHTVAFFGYFFRFFFAWRQPSGIKFETIISKNSNREAIWVQFPSGINLLQTTLFLMHLMKVLRKQFPKQYMKQHYGEWR